MELVLDPVFGLRLEMASASNSGLVSEFEQATALAPRSRLGTEYEWELG
jgi:hypothetical protein